MIITCENCNSSYEIEPSSLGEKGRTVRCAACGNKWHVPAENAPSSAGNQVLAIYEQAVPLGLAGGESFRPESYEKLDANAAPRGTSRFMAVSPPVRARNRNRLSAIAAITGIALVLSLVVWCNEIVAALPSAASLFEALGMPVNLRGLTFRDIKTVESIDNGVPVLVVNGAIDNIVGNTVEVPKLRLAVREGSGREIFVWTALPGRPKLSPGETLPFSVELAAPPVEGREIAVRFLSDRDIALNASDEGPQ